MNRRFKLDRIHNDVGILALLWRAESENDFILLGFSYEVQEMTQGLYTRFFEPFLGEDVERLRRFTACFLLPQYFLLRKNAGASHFREVLLILPESRLMLGLFNLLQEQYQEISLHETDDSQRKKRLAPVLGEYLNRIYQEPESFRFVQLESRLENYATTLGKDVQYLEVRNCSEVESPEIIEKLLRRATVDLEDHLE